MRVFRPPILKTDLEALQLSRSHKILFLRSGNYRIYQYHIVSETVNGFKSELEKICNTRTGYFMVHQA